MSFMIFLFFLALYCFVGGLWGGKFSKARLAVCKDCASPHRTCYREHGVTAFFSAVFWPLSIPMYAGMVVANRDELREQRELDAAEHELKLAKIRKQEAEEVEAAYQAAIRSKQPQPILDSSADNKQTMRKIRRVK